MRVRNKPGKRKSTCSKCNVDLSESRKNQRYCNSCHAEHMRNTRPKHSELTDLQRKKANCRSYLNVYLKRGYLSKKPCFICGSLNVEAHHEDYDKPLDVIWYCRQHHLSYHKVNSI